MCRHDASANLIFQASRTLFDEWSLESEVKLGRLSVSHSRRSFDSCAHLVDRIRGRLERDSPLIHRWALVYGAGVRVVVTGLEAGAEAGFWGWFRRDFVTAPDFVVSLQGDHARIVSLERIRVDIPEFRGEVVSLADFKVRRAQEAMPLVALWLRDEPLLELALVLRQADIHSLVDLRERGKPVLANLRMRGRRWQTTLAELDQWLNRYDWIRLPPGVHQRG